MAKTEGVEAPRARAAYDALRRKIVKLHPGVPLPSVPDLMDELGVGRVTLDKAYALLERQGYIERRRRRGVFVADRMATGEVAIVMKQMLLEPGASPSYARQCALLRETLFERHPNWAVKLHLGAGGGRGTDLPACLDLLDPGVLPRLRGVISFHYLYEMDAALAAAGVPTVYLGDSTSAAPRIGMNVRQMLIDGLVHLVARGCRDIRLLRARYVGDSVPTGEDRGRLAAVVAEKFGFTLRDEWVGCGDSGWTERDGYDLFQRLWSQPDRPDGVLVTDDVLCGGVLRAILARQLSMPDDLRLVTHASRGVGLPYHEAVTRVEFDLKELTDGAIGMLETLLQGDSLAAERIDVRGTLIQGTTS